MSGTKWDMEVGENHLVELVEWQGGVDLRIVHRTQRNGDVAQGAVVLMPGAALALAIGLLAKTGQVEALSAKARRKAGLS